MAGDEKIRKSVRAIISSMIPVTIQWAVVDSVDTDSGLMTAIGMDDDLPYEDILLSISGTGIVVMPEVGTKVLLGLIENSDTNALLLMAESVESYLITVKNGFKWHLKDDGNLEINGGAFGGLTKTPALVSELNKTNALLTSIMGVINSAPIPEPGNGAPSALQTALKAAIAGKTTGNYSNIENTSITHG